MKTKFLPLFIGLFTFLGYNSQAQLYIDTTITVEQMVMDFFDGANISVSNVTYTGSPLSRGYFEGATTDLGIPAGILLSTGQATDAIGPSTGSGTSTSLGEPGDDDLSNDTGFPTYDATILEMDIVSAVSDTLQFFYSFASEEYNEFVASGFNDIFAFYVEGPGTNGLHNIAMVPGEDYPVTINTVNLDSNAVYYVDYVANGGTDLEYDGITVELSAPFVVTAMETYHIKIAIADASDAAFDSGVFLGIESLDGDSLLSPPASANISVVGNTIHIENDSRYATSYLWDFGDNTTSTERNPEPHEYAAPGDYDFSLITYNYCCSDTFTTTITVVAAPSADFTAEGPVENCAPYGVQFQDISSDEPTSWEWSFPGGTPSTSTEQNPFVTYEEAGNYDVSLTVSNAGGENTLANENFVEVITTPDVEFSYDILNTVGEVAFTSNITGVVDGYEWDFGDNTTSTEASPTHIYTAGGTYTVTLTAYNVCGSIVSEEAIMLVIVGVENISSIQSLAVFPNPSNGRFTMKLAGQGSDQLELRLLNLLGQDLYQTKLSFANGQLTQDFDFGDLQAGTYLLQLQDGQEIGYYKLMIE